MIIMGAVCVLKAVKIGRFIEHSPFSLACPQKICQPGLKPQGLSIMRHILSIGLLSFIITACGDSSTTREGTGPVQTAPILKFVEFEDYDASFSSDGTKAAFLSNRTAGTPLAYYFDAAAETKLVRLDDKLSLDPADGRESWVSLNNSGS
ncbi:MAG: hypothetical protein EOP10_28255, partial [Proteobacteria bacterium]